MNRSIRHICLLCFLPVLMAGCHFMAEHDFSGMVVGSSPAVDTRFAQSCKWAEEHPFSIEVNDSAYHIHIVTDSHIDSTRTTDDVKRFVKAYREDENCPVALHLGDIVSTNEGFAQYLDALSQVEAPKRDTLLYTVGNHDLCFGLWPQWCEHFHCSTYIFETTLKGHALDLYICLDTGSGTIGRKQLAWLRSVLAAHPRTNYRHVVVYTHTNFFNDNSIPSLSSCLSVEETYLLTDILSTYGVSLVLSGHAHTAEDDTYGGVRYLTLETFLHRVWSVANMADSLTVSACSL